jgi:two-component system NarL family sensor kinase
MSTTDRQTRPPWILVAAGTAVRDQTAPVRRQRVITQVVAGAILVIVAVALVGVVAARRLAEAEAVNDAAKTADILAEAVVQPVVVDDLLTGDAAALASMDSAVRQHVLSSSIVRVKIWDAEGRILYSDEPALIGRQFPLGADERDVFTNPGDQRRCL